MFECKIDDKNMFEARIDKQKGINKEFPKRRLNIEYKT